jgi:ATP-dependent Lon protease
VGIVSALTGRPVKPAIALTGEVTLHGEVLGVGGISWKLRAAAKAGRKLVLIPAEKAKEVLSALAGVPKSDRIGTF